MDLRGYSGTVYGTGTLESMVAIGLNNNSSDTFASSQYQGRVVNGVEWQTLDEGSAPSRAGGWHQLKIEITATQVKFYVDGVLSETEARPNGFGFDWVVLGSDLTAAGFQAAVDNLVIRRRAAAFVHAAAAGREHLCRRQPASPWRPAARGLTYRWQKNGVDLANGGHFSGADTAHADDHGCGQQRCGQLPLPRNQCGRFGDLEPCGADRPGGTDDHAATGGAGPVPAR